MSAVDEQESDVQEGFFATILTPGSSLSPIFLNILDGAFAALLLVFLALIYVTSGNPHIFALIFIELGLWASVKWFVQELKNAQEEAREHKESKTK